MRLDVYFRAGKSLVKQAEAYHQNGSLDNAYIYYKRFLNLAVNEIPNHRDFKTARYAPDKRWLLQERTRLIEELENIVIMMDMEEMEKAGVLGGIDEAKAGSAALLDSMPKFPSSSEKTADPEMAAFEARLAALKGLGGETSGHHSLEPSAPPMPGPEIAPLAVPNLNSSGKQMPMADVFSILSQDAGQSPIGSYNISRQSSSQAAHLSRGHSLQEAHSISTHTQMLVEGKRPLNLPDSLVAIFSEIAHPNTITPPHGLETCGILAGKINNEELDVTHLIIPKQEASPNQCGMTNEDELFNYCFERDLLTLGWIHTHPTQSCFMSSVDLHTHAAYQALLPEAVAIVVAPTDSQKRVGVFRLTEPDGLQTIMTCTLKGFHQHRSDITIYHDVNVRWKSQDFETFDMR
eukprot:CAMPEP_0117870924 /NCGR_PEP_ID=MMETSP0950-20121206/10157_1 /TAXON_ID=44440 /ORGANISM="Chattonella subsalsa, Strain CCMP2191" /LENGTH=405 /DNA_ID=CAMNT_0005723359 /DNA_START=102 /DNA_END=1320 /DNA_ORIENTATION=+